MCFDVDSQPPVAPIAGAAVSHEDLVLTSADGILEATAVCFDPRR